MGIILYLVVMGRYHHNHKKTSEISFFCLTRNEESDIIGVNGLFRAKVDKIGKYEQNFGKPLICL